MVMANRRGQLGCILSLQAENTWIAEIIIAPEIVTQIKIMLASKRKKIKHCLCQSCSYATVCAALLWSNVLPERSQFVSYREKCYIHGGSHLVFSSVFGSQQQPKTVYIVKNERCTRIHEFNDTIHEWMPHNCLKMQIYSCWIHKNARSHNTRYR